jgi:outer membrane receptor protein involved in Fe transport
MYRRKYLQAVRAGALLGASALCMEGLWAMPAHAQATGAQASIETVTVTAERRSQSLLDVPSAVSVLGGDKLQDLGITGTRDLLQQVPGVNLASGGPSFVQEITMRGQGAGRNGFSETATGLYENGSYMAGGGFNGRQLSELNFFDVDRIEILHGPQGALYGRNSVGGAVNVIVNEPQSEFSAREQAQYGSQDSYGLQGVVNVPINLGDLELDTRVGAFYNDQESGFIRNLTTGNRVDKSSSFGARAGFLIHPTENSKLYAQVEYYDDKEPSFGTLAYVVGYRATTSAFTAGAPVDPGPYTRDHLTREGRTDAPDLTATVDFDQTTSLGDFSLKFYNRNRNAGRSNEDYEHYLGLPGFDPAGTGGVKLVTDLGQHQYEGFHLYDTQATFASNGNGPWHWLFGAEMLTFEDNVRTGFDNCAPYDPSPKTSAQMEAYQTNGDGGCVVGLVPTAAAYTSPALFKADVAVENVIRNLVNSSTYQNEITSYAGFATASYDFDPQWTLGVEGRVTTDKNKYFVLDYSQDPLSYWGSGAVPAGFAKPIAGEQCPPQVAAAGQCAGAPPPYAQHESHRWNEFLPGATLTYKVTDSQTLYARFATGYRPGGFNDPLIAVQSAYKPEYTQSGEVGWKGLLLGVLDGDLDAYYQKTRNVQLVQYSQASSGGFVLQNVGNDHVYGIEANLAHDFGNVGPGDMRLSANLSSNNGKFSSGTEIAEKPPYGPVSLAGLRVPFTYDIQGALDGTYSVPVGNGYNAQFEANYQFASGGVWQYSGANGVLTTLNNANRNELDLYVRLFSPDGWMISAFGKNVTDDRYLVATVSAAQYWSQPTTWGVAITAMQ